MFPSVRTIYEISHSHSAESVSEIRRPGIVFIIVIWTKMFAEDAIIFGRKSNDLAAQKFDVVTNDISFFPDLSDWRGCRLGEIERKKNVSYERDEEEKQPCRGIRWL